MIEGIVGGLLLATLWLGIWLSPMLLTMAAACLMVWGWQGADYLVNNIAMVLTLAAVRCLLPALAPEPHDAGGPAGVLSPCLSVSLSCHWAADTRVYPAFFMLSSRAGDEGRLLPGSWR